MAKVKTAESKSNDSGLDFEAQLWAAADKMRGHLDASEYKHFKKMTRLTETLQIQFAVSAKVEKAIRQNLKTLASDTDLLTERRFRCELIIA